MEMKELPLAAFLCAEQAEGMSGDHSPSLSLSFFERASVKINSEPTPSVLTTLMFCLWVAMISFTMERPRPVPFRSLPRETSIF